MKWLKKLIERFWGWFSTQDYEELFWKAYPHVAPILAGGLNISLQIVLSKNPGWTTYKLVQTLTPIVREVVAFFAATDMSNADKRTEAVALAKARAEDQGLKEIPSDVLGLFVDAAARVMWKALGGKWTSAGKEPQQIASMMQAAEGYEARNMEASRLT